MDQLKPPASENEDLHKKILERLARMTDQEFFDSTVRAGIRKADGSLEDAYQDSEETQQTAKGSLGR